ncbi:succinylglutamate desuccinylase/aspartoacylase family protein [Bosea sp. NPDC055332]
MTTSVDFDRQGRQSGFLSVPFSQHDSAYGRIQIPVTCIRNGEGPTALLLAGVHGDEYEGQIALGRLIRDLDPAALRGRLILLPALNLPAVSAARRVSPLDGGNLNRLFPGDPDGAPTAMIAHYVEQVLLPMADLAIDLHSGGSSLDYAPCAIVRDDGPDDLVARQFGVLRAFGGRYAYVTDGRNQGAERTFAAAAARSGVIAITTELGGAAAANPEGIRLAENGIRRVLQHLGMLDEEPEPDSRSLRLMQVEGAASYTLAPEDGVFECLVNLESEVVAGALAGYVHCPETPWRLPVPVHVEATGLVICKRAVAWTRRGDCLLQILAPYAGKGARA